MRVVATAGHVDHGKSTLVRALTGMEPDRWAQERRRGMTIDLGFAWTRVSSGGHLAFVDVPGHERFVTNMLAGVGPAPAVMFVVAADEGWMPQSTEHLAALHALDLRSGLLVVTRADLADPGPAMAQARARIGESALGAVEAVAVSARTGHGMDDLRAALTRVTDALPTPVTDGPVRLWVDRSFSIRGSGTVVTGTLAAGRVRVGDTYTIASTNRRVRVRGVQALGRAVPEVTAVARVAVNLRGVDVAEIGRGDALLTPERFVSTGEFDVRVHGDSAASLPRGAVLHVGSAAVAVRVRALGTDTARLRAETALPLRPGERALLRDPGLRRILGGVVILDVRPPDLRGRRGAAAARAVELAGMRDIPDEAAELSRRKLVRRRDLGAMGIDTDRAAVAGDWLADPTHWNALRERLRGLVDAVHADRDLDAGLSVEEARRTLGLADRELLLALVEPPLTVRQGRIVHRARVTALPAGVAAAVDVLVEELTHAPFAARTAEGLAALGLGRREVAASVRAGALFRAADAVLLLPDAPQEAMRRLAVLEQPFTVARARAALHTTRRVAMPVLEHLERTGHIRRLPDDRRIVVRDDGSGAVPG